MFLLSVFRSLGDIMKVNFLQICLVWFAEWIKSVDQSRWKKEYIQMDQISRKRYDFIAENYDGIFKRKIIKNNA